MRYESEKRPASPNAGYVEDFTIPFLVSFGVVLFCALVALFSFVGMPLTLLAAYLGDLWLKRRS